MSKADQTFILIGAVDLWLSQLDQRFKRIFPNHQLPYPPKQLTKIASFLDVRGHDRRKLLRFEMRQLALATLCALDNRKYLRRSDMRSEIDRSIIKPIDQLTKGIMLIDKIGVEEAYALAHETETSVDMTQLTKDLTRLREWSEQAKTRTKEPSVPKGITGVRQDFVDRLYEIYHSYSGKIPGRSSQSDPDGKWHNDSEFSIFVDLCAEPIFNEKQNFDRQIRLAQETHKGWISAGQKLPEKKRGFVHRTRSKMRPS